MKVKSIEVVCPECEAEEGEWCRDLVFGIRVGVRGGYLLMHSSRTVEKETVQ